MKNYIFKSEFSRTLEKNKKLYLLSFFLIVTGITIGSIFALTRPENTNQAIKQYLDNFMTAFTLQGISKNEIFRLSFFNSLRSFIIFCISGLSVWLLSLGGIHLFLCGFKLGFTLLYFIKIFYFKGFIAGVLLLLPQILFFIPAICYLYVDKITMAKKRKSLIKNRVSNIKNSNLFKPFTISFLIYWSITLLSCILDGYIVPSIIKHICKLFI